MTTAQDFHDIEIQKENPEELFENLQVLGKGTFGTVIKARNRQTNEIVAVKQILLVNNDEIDVVRKEVKILHQCSHPNIVKYRGTYLTINTLWIVMEYCAGGSVDGVFKTLKRPLSEALVAYVCREVLKGLMYLHRNHKIHRDIKGGNILLTGDGAVKLADFGVSTELVHTLSRRNSFIGTLYWMAPEAIQEKEYDERADLWSLGITVIEMAEAAPPHMGMHYGRALFAIPKDAPPTLHHRDRWSPLMHKFLARLLVKDPQYRPIASQMLTDPFVAPERVGTAEQLKAVIEEVLARQEQMTTARRLGEDTSTSSMTFVERDSEREEASSRRGASGQGGGGGAGAGGGDAKPSGSPADAVGVPNAAGAIDLVPSSSHAVFHDGTLVELPVLSTEDLSFDELGFGLPYAPLATVPAAADLLGCSPHDVPVQQNQTIFTLLAAYHYHHDMVYRAGVTPNQAEASKELTIKYGSVLRTVFRV